MRVPTTTPAPFLRWAGGKRRLLPVLLAGMPARFGSFYEPFVGGGALTFALNLARHPAHINDSNPYLATTYTVLRDRPEALIAALRQHAEHAGQAAYLALRQQQPTDPVEVAAWFIALNRQAFQGLMRFNKSGRFNTPWGKLANPTVCDEELLRLDSSHLHGTTITQSGFATAVETASTGDFVYLDPPYIPASATSSFTAYSADGFGLEDHRELRDVVEDLRGRGAHVMLSNSDTDTARELFANLDLHTVSVRRSISAAATSRRVVTEIIGLSYPLTDCADPGTFQQLLR